MEQYHGDRIGPATSIFGDNRPRRKDGITIKTGKEQYYDEIKTLFETSLKFLFTPNEINLFNQHYFYQLPNAEFKNPVATVLAFACLIYNTRTEHYELHNGKIRQMKELMERENGPVHRLIQERGVTLLDLVRYIRMLMMKK